MTRLEPYLTRRRALMERAAGGLILVRGAGPEGVNPNFLYLTGIREPRGALLLAPSRARIEVGRKYPGREYVAGRMVHQVLFLPQADPVAARWGEDAAATTGSVQAEEIGVDAVLPEAELMTTLERELQRSPGLLVVRSASPTLTGPEDPDAALVERIHHRFFGFRVADATYIVQEMRRLKDDDEVARIERAVEVTREALEAAAAAAGPGVPEYVLESEILRVYRSHGGTPAFETIVGSGPRATQLHYCENEHTIGTGDLVLVDTGAKLGGYCADVTRTFPASGKFTKRQAEVYSAVLKATEEATTMVAPGVLLEEIHARAFDVIAGAGFGEYFVHGTSHYLGIEVHDVGDVYTPLGPGAVITVEPGIYIPEEGLGVRIEDDVLVTPDGHRVLTESIPRSLEEMERMVAGKAPKAG